MTTPDPIPTLPEATVRALLAVRAIEECDGEGRWLAPRERAPAAASDPATAGAALARRAAALLAAVSERSGAPQRWLAAAAWRPPAAGIALGAGALGLAANALGTADRVNVLAPPLMGVLVWNAFVYVLLAWSSLRSRPPGAPRASGVRALAARLAQARVLRRTAQRAGGDVALEARASARFADLWTQAAAPLLGARLRAALHAGAMALLLGMLAGMYTRGVAMEYRATWSSTFLGPRAVDALLGAVLAPARALTGIAVPAASSLRAPASGPAGPWIHLWSATTVLFVLVPRAALYARDARRARRLARGLPLDLAEAYWRRSAGASHVRVHLLPVGAAPRPRAADALRELALEVFGSRAEVSSMPSADYAAETLELPALDAESGLLVVFSARQTPELEVHARLLVQALTRLPNGARVLCVVDESGFEERLGGGEAAGERRTQRRRAWERALRDVGPQPLFADLERGDVGELVRAAERQMWTRATAGERGGVGA